MAVHNIAHVTRSIIRLIDIRLRPALGTAPGSQHTYPVPLDQMGNPGLSFFLYHIQENATYRNYPSQGKSHSPVQLAPMGINLYYQLSPYHTDESSDINIYQMQLMMGIAMKALHDYPIVTDETQVEDPLTGDMVNIMDTALLGKDNRFKIDLQPISYSEAIQYWTAGNSPLKLAAYYEVSVILLEPEPVQTIAGRVLRYGTFVFPEGAPRITRSRNVLEFVPPGGEAPQQMNIQPAQTPYDHEIEFQGTGFSGDVIELLLYSREWNGSALTVGWSPVANGTDKVVATVRETAIQEKDGVPVWVVPGVYSAQIRVSRSRTLPDGTVRQFSHSSNQFPFTVIPKLEPIPSPVGGVVTITGRLFRHPDPTKEIDLEVYLGENRLPQDEALTEGSFSVSDDSSRLILRLPAGLTGGKTAPLRILVNGAESPPHWITA